MFLEMIFKIVLVFDPEFPIRVYNKLHQLPLRIAYINLGIVPLATSAFFFMLTHCFPELIITFTLSALGAIFRDCLFFISTKSDLHFPAIHIFYSSKFRCIFGFPPQRPYRPIYGISDNRGVRLFPPAAPPPFLPDTVEEPEIRKMMQDADSLNLVRLVVLKTAHFPAMLYIPGNDTLPVAVYAFILQKSTLAALTVLFHLSPVL
jgi:hypothetical protein